MRTVVYTGNRKVYKSMATAAKSMLYHKGADRILFLIEDDAFPEPLPPQIEVRNVSGQTFFRPDGPNYKSHWSYLALMKAAVPFLSGVEDRVLVLDVDTIVCGSLDELWSLPDAPIYMAREVARQEEYYNSGVMLMDTDALQVPFREVLKRINEQKYPFGDQDAINEVLKDRIRTLPPEYNASDWTVAPKNPVKIRHFAGIQNWEDDPLYKEYEKMTWETAAAGKAEGKKKPRILIAVPALDYVKTDFLICLMGLRTAGASTQLAVARGSLVYNARADLTLKAIQGGFTHILWLDSDMTFEPDIAVRLLADIEEGRDFVTGLCFKKAIPTMPTILSGVEWEQKPNGEKDGRVDYFTDYPADSVFEIAGCGLAACITSVDMLKKAAGHFKGSPFEPLPGLGEDYSLCWRLRKMGYRLYCDSRVKVGHIGDFIYDEDIYKRQGIEDHGNG